MRSKTLSSDRCAPASLAVSVVGAAVALTCAAGSVAPAPPAAPPATPTRAGPTAPSSAPVTAPSGSVASSPPAPDAGAPAPDLLPLPRFQAALAALARGERRSHVRIAWLGDSHTAADYWTHALRRPLQERYGNGGPGFVRLGVEPYRHALVKVGRAGKWRREPGSPAASTKQLDGVFGLGGMRVVPESADASVSVELLPGAAQGRTRFTLVYRARAAGRLRLAVRGTATAHTLDPASGRKVGALRHHDIEADAPATFELSVSAGAPEVFGAFVESEEPGVVLDTLGIDGARAATPLAWDEQEWQAALAARDPVLIVLAYGTNEVASTLDGARYQAALEGLMQRARAAAPGADCLFVGPPDMATVGGESAPRVLEFDELAAATARRVSCAYFSALGAMGGEGSFARWAKERPPLAAADRVHLAPTGYARLGEALARRILPGLPPTASSP